MSYVMPYEISTAEYRAFLDKLSVAQEEVGRVLGISGRNARRYASGETPVPPWLAAIVRLWQARPEDFRLMQDWATEDEQPKRRK